MYDEKYIMMPRLTSNKFDTKSPQTWLQSTRDYIAGRTSELDPLLDWVEAQIEPISLDTLLHVAPAVRPDVPDGRCSREFD